MVVRAEGRPLQGRLRELPNWRTDHAAAPPHMSLRTRLLPGSRLLAACHVSSSARRPRVPWPPNPCTCCSTPGTLSCPADPNPAAGFVFIQQDFRVAFLTPSTQKVSSPCQGLLECPPHPHHCVHPRIVLVGRFSSQGLLAGQGQGWDGARTGPGDTLQ